VESSGKRFLYILTVFSLVLSLFGSVAATTYAQTPRDEREQVRENQEGASIASVRLSGGHRGL
jgi:hypothetical protein